MNDVAANDQLKISAAAFLSLAHRASTASCEAGVGVAPPAPLAATTRALLPRCSVCRCRYPVTCVTVAEQPEQLDLFTQPPPAVESGSHRLVAALVAPYVNRPATVTAACPDCAWRVVPRDVDSWPKLGALVARRVEREATADAAHDEEKNDPDVTATTATRVSATPDPTGNTAAEAVAVAPSRLVLPEHVEMLRFAGSPDAATVAAALESVGRGLAIDQHGVVAAARNRYPTVTALKELLSSTTPLHSAAGPETSIGDGDAAPLVMKEGTQRPHYYGDLLEEAAVAALPLKALPCASGQAQHGDGDGHGTKANEVPPGLACGAQHSVTGSSGSATIATLRCQMTKLSLLDNNEKLADEARLTRPTDVFCSTFAPIPLTFFELGCASHIRSPSLLKAFFNAIGPTVQGVTARNVYFQYYEANVVDRICQTAWAGMTDRVSPSWTFMGDGRPSRSGIDLRNAVVKWLMVERGVEEGPEMSVAAAHPDWALTVDVARRILAACPDCNVFGDLKQLTALDLSTCSDLSKDMSMLLFAAIPRPERLTTLILESVGSGTDTAALCTNIATCFSNLRLLNLFQAPHLCDDHLVLLTPAAGQLRELWLGFSDLISDDGVAALIRDGMTGRDLRVLSIPFCSQIGDGTIEAVARYCPRLTHLNIAASKVTDDGMASLCPSIDGSDDDSDSFKNSDGKCCVHGDSQPSIPTLPVPLLESLDVSGCQSMLSTSVAAVTAAHPRIRSLKMQHWGSLRDVKFANIVAPLHRLEDLDLSFCWRVSDETLQAVVRRHQRWMWRLHDTSAAEHRGAVEIAEWLEGAEPSPV